MRTIASELEVSRIIENDNWMMDVLRAAEEMNLPDWWIGAGFLRNKVWDYLQDNHSKPTRDVDLVYFNSTDQSAETDWELDATMKTAHPFANWEVRNQARMHYMSDSKPFTSTEDGIKHWVETATCIAVKLEHGTLKFLFCHGTEDLFNLIARPSPFFNTESRIGTFYSRLEHKQWKQRWPDLRISTL